MALFKTGLLRCFILIQTFWLVQVGLSQPIADFTATPLTGCSPLLVQFTDMSTGSPTSWKWDLGDGTISVIQNPSKTYFTPGQYKISLIVTNASGSNTVVKDRFITVQFNPAANYTSNVTTGCLPLPVQFTDQSTAASGTVSSWKWDFGDGIIDSVKNPQHTYTAFGTFDVTLQVKNTTGCPGTISKSKFINTGNAVKAAFSNNFQSTCKPPVNLSLSNLSQGQSLTYQWAFGDGAVSTAVNPSHTYSTAGNFTVRLIAKNGSGCVDTAQKEINIGTVNADFSGPVSVCPRTSSSFKNTSAPSPSGAFWDFGDGTTSTSFDPVKTYSTPGNYTVKMIADFGACSDSVTKAITVLPKAIKDFTADKTLGCTLPFTAKFASNVAGAKDYLWNFGDNRYSTAANPTYTYSFYSTFSVFLYVTDSAGCKDTLVKPNYVNVRQVQVTLPALPQKNCVPFTYRFFPAITAQDSVVSYRWNFGDGKKDSVANPVHTFSAVGSYTITLTVTTISGCTGTLSVVNGIAVGNKPVANFSASPLTACASTPIQFTDLSTGNVDEWLWDFGDKSTSTLKNPDHLYLDTGYFKVGLTVRSSGCPDSISFTKYIYIKPAVSIFSIKGNCALPKVKTFINSSRSADTYEWDFGDGTALSTARNPVHAYVDTGTYPVTLKVSNLTTGCVHSITKPAQVIIEKAMFTVSDTGVCKGTTILFRKQNIISDKISTFSWYFGDGSPVQIANDSVYHQYLANGNFNPTLIITDIHGCRDTLTKPSYIKVNGPVAQFKINAPGSCINTPVDFIDNSVANGSPIVQWVWDYGDNTIVSLSAPPFKHTYTVAGVYTVKVKVTDDNGCADSLTKTDYIEITQPFADFTSTDTASCPLAPVNFTSLATGINLSYLWDFGDGASAKSANVTHSYATPNNYTVSLKVTDQYGCTVSMQKTNYISIRLPKAGFRLSDSISACPPFFVTFNNTSSNYTSLSWDFGDGNFSSSVNPTHFYYIPGVYSVKLKVAGPGGCEDEVSNSITVKGPVGVLTYTNITGCNTVKTNFKATAKDNLLFTWDFNDGNTVRTRDSSISYTYTNTGFYLPRLILEDANGCQVPITGIDTIKVLTVQNNFYTASKLLCDAGNINFLDSTVSNDRVTGYLWNFGDGSTSLQQNPVHTYTSPGSYTVSQSVTTLNGCKDTATKPGYINVIARPNINIQSDASACALDTISFQGIFIQPDTSLVTWQWNFGNGQMASIQNPPVQTYAVAGGYSIRAVATNSSGCKDTATQSINVNPLPVTNAGNDAFLCLGTPLQLHVSGAVSYQWLSPASFLSCINCSNPYSSAPADITYTVKGTNGFNCSALDSVTIRVKRPFKVTVTPAIDSICIGQSSQLTASGAERYLWSPSQGLNNAFISNPVASPGGNTAYKVLAYDTAGCFGDSADVSIIVFSYPLVDAGSDKNILLGESVALSPSYSSDVVNWLWTPGTGLNCTVCPAPVATPDISTEYTIKVANSAGCSATAMVTVLVTCNSDNLFMPNTFSPNGDGVNDVFFPRGKGINKIRGMKIFNRWGELVFEKSNFFANDISAGWNGSLGGKKLPADVYTFVIDVICSNNDLISRSGNITLLK